MFFLSLMLGPALAGQELRPLTADDLSRLQRVSEAHISPDGMELAYVVSRPMGDKPDGPQYPVSQGEYEGDVWIQSVTGGAAQQLKVNGGDRLVFRRISWSPDGRYLAMYASEGVGQGKTNAALWAWDKQSSQIRRVTPRLIDTSWRSGPRCQWLSNHKLVCPLCARDAKAEKSTLEYRTAMSTTKQSANTFEGREAAVSVIESGTESAVVDFGQDDLAIEDVGSGAESILGSGNFHQIEVSPDAKFIGVLRIESGHLPQLDTNMQSYVWMPGEALAIAVVSSDGSIRQLNCAGCNDVYSESLEWSPTGRELAFVARRKIGDSQQKDEVYAYRVDGGEVDHFVSENIRVATTHPLWAAQDKLIVAAKAVTVSRDVRNDWWSLDLHNSAVSLTERLPIVPSDLLQEKNSEAYWGVAGSKFVRLDANGTATFDPLKSGQMFNWSVEWPTEEANCDRCRYGTGKLVVSIRESDADHVYEFDLHSHDLNELKDYRTGSDLLAYAESNGTAIFLESDHLGTRMWVIGEDEKAPRLLQNLNAFLSGVAQSATRSIRYRSEEGTELNGCVILPIGYVRGKKYPLVTFVYPGMVYGDSCSARGQLTQINDATFLNLQLLAAHGYAVLLPSMPVATTTNDPYHSLADGVLPAVDKAIVVGFADPQRLGLLGHSFGGFAVLGLITQTKRFQAAIAISAVSDFVSHYGTFGPGDDMPIDQMWRMSWAETGQPNFGIPLLKDPLRYLQNSPLVYAGRVETPVLIVQGDLDGAAPLNQGEEFFTALFRQNKRAQFVRYFGEGHLLESSANIKDLWERMYRWFDEFLVPR
jgi:dipeptidyl aminopeptidase/acylaminoacyl peptidase